MKEVWIPPYDEWAKESELTWWFGKWRDTKSALGFDFLYEDKKPRHEYPKSDDWEDQEYPVIFDSAWAQGKPAWQVWLDAYDAWDHEVKRLTEVYTRISEPMDLEEAECLWEGKFPLPPLMPDKVMKLFQTAINGDIVNMAGMLEDDEVDPLSRDQNLQTPLMYAAVGGSLECVEYLIDFGADMSHKDNKGDTAFDLAVAAFADSNPQHPVIAYFKNNGAPRGHGERSKRWI